MGSNPAPSLAECRGAIAAVAESLKQAADTLKAVATKLAAIEREKSETPRRVAEKPRRRGPRMRNTFPKEGLATVADACEFLGVGRSTVYALMHAGTLPTSKVGRARRFSWEALHRFASGARRQEQK